MAEAGLDIAQLRTLGQLEIMELDLTLPPEEWVRPWSALLDDRLGAGFDALWFTRFPVGLHAAEIAAVLPYEEAWMRCFGARRVVTLCPYIYTDMSPDVRAAHLADIASVHDRVVDIDEAG